jgi:hypothetical protein
MDNIRAKKIMFASTKRELHKKRKENKSSKLVEKKKTVHIQKQITPLLWISDKNKHCRGQSNEPSYQA